jgi:hypothetical protein
MPDTIHLGLPLIEAAQAQKHVTHNEALLRLDTLVQLAVTSRALSAPPAAPAEGDRYIVKAVGTGAFAGKDNQLAQFSDGGWVFYPPKVGWLAFIADEGVLVAWDGSAWVAAVSSSGDISELQNLLRLGVGTEADATNPFSAKLNNALWVARTEGEGGDGNLRYTLSKESAAKTLSILYQNNFSGRAEIGLCGDDDFHFKVSPDGSSWIDALVLDRATGAAKLNAGLCLAGDISPPQIAADQNDYNPSGLATASVLRLDSDASRNITGLAGGGDGRIVAIVNVGANNIVLKDASTSSAAANRFAFGADVTLGAKQCAVLWYDAAEQRWKLLAAPQASGGGGGGEAPADLELLVGQLALGLADALNAAQFLGAAGNRFADSFDTLTYVDAAGAVNLDTGTAGVLKPTASYDSATKLLIHADAADGSTAFVDAATGKTITANGNAQIDTDQARFGAAAALFDGAGDSLTLADHADWDFGSGNFTVDFWVRFASVSANRCLFMQGDAWNSNFSWGVQWVQGTNQLTFYYTTDGSTLQSRTFSWVPSANAWYHVAIVRNGDDLKVFVDGSQIGSTQNLSGATVFNSSAVLTIGASISGFSGDHNGWLDEIRISKGVARWTANFTPPSSAYQPNAVNNMTVVSTSLPAASAPAVMKVVARAKFVDTVALNTDYKISVSRDNGTTWTYAALNDRFAVNALHMLESDAIDVSGQPSGTHIKWRIKTLNNKMIETHDIYLCWQ